MKTSLQVFTNAQFGEIRTVLIKGEPWFIATDVCRALEVSNVSDAVARLDDDEKGIASTDTLGGKQNMLSVNESGLYALIMNSRKPEAKSFRKWVTSEVLPTLRKTGKYAIEVDVAIPAANAMKDARILADEIQAEFIGVQRGIALSKAFDITEKVHNISLQPLKELLPPAEHDTGFLNPTQIGEKLGGLPPQAVNKMISANGLQYKSESGWRLTVFGREHGEEVPFTRNGHSGYQIRWNESIVDFLKSGGVGA